MAKIHFKGQNIEEVRDLILKKLKITYIGHSMGGLSLTVYVIKSRLENKPHYLSKAILLSPAGVHENAPRFIFIMGWLFDNILKNFISGIGFPAIANYLTSKMHKDC